MVMLLGTLLALVFFALVVLAWLWTRLPKGLRGVLVEHGFPAVARVVRFLCRAPAQFGVTLVAEVWGRAALSALVGVMLWDAAWGGDSIGVPVIGSLGLLLAALVVGGFQVRRWDGWCRAAEEVLRENVPRYRQTEDRRKATKYGGGGPLRLYVGEYAFRFGVPAGIQPSELVELEERMRTRLPAVEGTNFGFDWALKKHLCRVAAVEDIPTNITLAAAMSAAQASAAGYAPNWATPLSADPLKIPLGLALGREGLEEIVWDVKNLYGSLIVAGAPGGGKSCLIRQIVACCLQAEAQEAWEVWVTDMKMGVELGYMRRYAPVVSRVATELEDAAETFSAARKEMYRRYRLFKKAGVPNIHEYNALQESRGLPRLRHLLVVSDEVAELLMAEKGKSEEAQARSELKDLIRPDMLSMAQLGRAAGVHQVLSTQRPTKEFIDTAIKSLVLARVAMGGLDRIGSDVAIESPLAADLPGISGRGVFYLSGQLQQFQAYYASEADLDAIHAAQARGGRDLAA